MSLAAPSQRSSPLGYMPQLDAMRGAGVLLVMFQHFNQQVAHGWNVGLAAMGMFFTMSGYLITGILLRSRDKMDAGQLGFKEAYWHYFVRRALRIFPAYYALILLTFVTNSGRMQRDVFWHASYLSNVMYTYVHREMNASIHLWSLSVEEQFYLFWPFFILLGPRRLMVPLMLAIAAAGIVYRHYADGVEQRLMTFAHLDYLALGSLLAVVDLRSIVGRVVPRWRKALPLAFLAVAMAMLMLWYFEKPLQLGYTGWTILRTSFCFFALWLVAGGSLGFRGPLGFVLNLRPLIYLGTISYGVYLIHNYFSSWVRKSFDGLGIVSREGWNDWAFFVVASAVAIAWGAASWRFFEAPILALKDRLAPVRPRGAGEPSAPASVPAPSPAACGDAVPALAGSTLGACPPGSAPSS